MDVGDELTRLVALSPDDGLISGLVRRMCGQTLSLPPLPAEVAVDGPESDAETVVASFAEQFSIDVSAIGDEHRSRLSAALGNNVFRAVVLMYIADFITRVRAGLEALGVGQEYLERCTVAGRYRCRRRLQVTRPLLRRRGHRADLRRDAQCQQQDRGVAATLPGSSRARSAI